MKKIFIRSVLSLGLLAMVSCSADTESLDGISSESESLKVSEPPSTSRVQPVKGKTYYIKNVLSQKYMDVSRNSKSNGANVHQWAFTGANNQKWKIEDFEGNARLISVHSGKSLDIEGKSISNKANVQQWASSGNENQKFRITATSSGRFFIENVGAGKRLRVEGTETGNGANIIQYFHSGSDQSAREWAFYETN